MTYLHARIWAPRIPASISRMRRLPAIVLIAALAALAPATAGAADLFNNWNTSSVQNAPTGVTVFTLAAPAHITELVTYHWNNGRGLPALPPVTITLTGATGATFGPFTAVGSPGTNGVLNVNPSLALNPGRRVSNMRSSSYVDPPWSRWWLRVSISPRSMFTTPPNDRSRSEKR